MADETKLEDPTELERGAELDLLRQQRQTLLTDKRNMDSRLFDFRSLLRAARALHYCRDVPNLMAVLKAIICDKLDATGVWIFLYDEEQNKFTLELAYDGAMRQTEELPKTGAVFSFALQPGILWQLVCQGVSFSVVDLDGNFRFPELFAATKLDRFHATQWLPLAMENRPVGLVALGPLRDGRAYAEQEEEFLSTVGEQAAVAIGSVFLYTKLQEEQEKLDRTIRNLSVLYDISKAISQIDDMNQLLLEILDKAIQRVGAQKGSIMLYAADQDLLRVQVVRGLPDKRTEDEINCGEKKCKTFRPGEGVAGTVFETRKVYVANNTGRDEKYQHAKDSNVSSIVCLPLLIDDEAIGVINITNKQDSTFIDEDIEILAAIGNQAAVTIRKADLYQLAITDELTKLFVRRFFFRRMDEELRRQQRYKTHISVLMLDIDHFKKFNDTYGHEMGDEVLKAVARTLTAQAREVDVVARHGGEEFTVLLPETDLEGARVAGERFRVAIEALEVPHESGTLKVTMSFGAAQASDDTPKGDDLLRNADVALYQAKAQGRNRVVTWEEGMEIPDKH